jgi:hypothetical protein
MSLEDSGHFISYYKHNDREAKGEESDYYPGEAMFALHRAMPYLKGIDVCEISRKGMGFMLRPEKEKRELDPEKGRVINQWHFYVVREHREHCKDKQFDWLMTRDFEFMYRSLAKSEKYPVLAGSFLLGRNKKPSQSPTHVESYFTICNALGSENAEIAKKCDETSELVAGMQLTFQFNEQSAWPYKNPQRAYGGMATALNDSSVRIDNTQHHLSGMYENLLFRQWKRGLKLEELRAELEKEKLDAAATPTSSATPTQQSSQ